MGYKALIDSKVTLAFNLVKDLAELVTFTKTTATTFDFNTASMGKVNETPIVVKAVITDAKKPSKDTNLIVKTIMFKSRDLGTDIGLYSSIKTKDGTDWKIGAPIKDYGFIWIFEILQEKV